jgi:SAM-dependent methyltransferase
VSAPHTGGAAVGPESASAEVWDANAKWWKETFTDGADREYEVEILPLVASELVGCRRIVDIGCGEGQVARRLADDGAAVFGVDPSRAQLTNALGIPRPEIAYIQALGEALPLSSGSVDGAVCCLVIEHTLDADAVLSEAARVLAPGGRFLLVINHPAFQGPGSGFVDDQILDERYWRVGPYLKEQWVIEKVDSAVSLGFSHRPLSRYINPAVGAGLVLTRLLEPAPRRELLDGSSDPDFETLIPRLCAMRFERPCATSC